MADEHEPQPTNKVPTLRSKDPQQTLGHPDLDLTIFPGLVQIPQVAFDSHWSLYNSAPRYQWNRMKIQPRRKHNRDSPCSARDFHRHSKSSGLIAPTVTEYCWQVFVQDPLLLLTILPLLHSTTINHHYPDSLLTASLSCPYCASVISSTHSLFPPSHPCFVELCSLDPRTGYGSAPAASNPEELTSSSSQVTPLFCPIIHNGPCGSSRDCGWRREATEGRPWTLSLLEAMVPCPVHPFVTELTV